MEQHPVPQPISTYQFRLVGDMTLRQFSQLAGGVIVALIIYSLPITPIIKWPLVLFFGFFGFALAFLPLEDRPLDKWLTAFFKSVYSPTQFIWKQQRRVPEFLKELPKKPAVETAKAKPFRAVKAELSEYLETFPTKPFESKIEKKESLALEKIEALFRSVRLPAAIIPKPKLKKKIIEEESKPQIKIKPRKLVVPPLEPIILRVETLSPVGPKPQPQPAPVAPKPPVKIAPKPKKKLRVKAKISPDLPIPTAPDQANIIVGMVLDSSGKIIENAIIEIRNKDGLPVRALRTNQLGQFQIVTSLSNGIYEIEIEKEGFEFDIIKLNLTGKIVQPIEIRAK